MASSTSGMPLSSEYAKGIAESDSIASPMIAVYKSRALKWGLKMIGAVTNEDVVSLGSSYVAVAVTSNKDQIVLYS
jgi:hypothetical protein